LKEGRGGKQKLREPGVTVPIWEVDGSLEIEHTRKKKKGRSEPNFVARPDSRTRRFPAEGSRSAVVVEKQRTKRRTGAIFFNIPDCDAQRKSAESEKSGGMGSFCRSRNRPFWGAIRIREETDGRKRCAGSYDGILGSKTHRRSLKGSVDHRGGGGGGPEPKTRVVTSRTHL